MAEAPCLCLCPSSTFHTSEHRPSRICQAQLHLPIRAIARRSSLDVLPIALTASIYTLALLRVVLDVHYKPSRSSNRILSADTSAR